MTRRVIAILGLFVVVTQQALVVLLGFGFESASGVLSYALLTGGGTLIVLSSIDPARFGLRVPRNRIAGTGLALVGIGVVASGTVYLDAGGETIDRLGSAAQLVAGLTIVWFGWQIGFDTRHANLDWMDGAD